MKMELFKGVFFLMFILLTNTVFAQDIIILKNGDEIKSKIIEVAPDIVKYKKWDNQDGPMYSSNKAEVFMIKYANGTKDVFNTAVTNSVQNNYLNDGSKFIGTWYHKKYDGKNNKTMILISRAGVDYLVEFKVMQRVDEFFFDNSGSFKEVGQMEGNSIVVNSSTKLSLINDITLLMDSKEFVKTPLNVQTSNASINTNNSTSINPNNISINVTNPKSIIPGYTGDYKEGKKEGKGKNVYSDGSTYEGEWRNDKRYGYGTFSSIKGDVYKGYWKDDKRDSTGVTLFVSTSSSITDIKFEGIYKNDKSFNGVLSSVNYKGQKSECICKNGVFGKWAKIRNK